MTALNVRVLLERQILRVAHNGLITPTGLEPADTVVCCTGSDPNFRVDLRGLSVQPGGIAVDSTLRSEEHDRVFVIGDGMLFREFGEARRDLHQAHRAVVQGRLAACNILRLLRAKPLQVYDPGSTPIGVMLQAKRGVFCYRERCINGRLAGYIKRWLELRPT